MPTESRDDAKAAQASDKQPATPLQRAGRVGLSIINPFSDLGVIYRKGVLPVADRFKLMRQLLTRATNRPDSSGVSWKEAVERSGRTADQLITNYKYIRAAFWGLMVIGVGLSSILLILLLANTSLPIAIVIRAVVMILVFAGAGSLGFTLALVSTYRLWQLQEHRVSVAERGTFRDFQAETRWVRNVLILGLSRK